MNSSDTTAINPRDDGTKKSDRMDQDAMPRPYHVSEPKPDPEVTPGPDTREEPASPK